MTIKSEPKLGVHLLESITLGMYNNPLHCIREYIQNSYDSIRSARRRSLIEPERGSIKLILDIDAKTLRIRDNGVGLSPEEAVVNLVDIGASDKAETKELAAGNAGFRGIGRLAGLSYCRHLRFETSTGGPKSCCIEFDAETIKTLIRPGQKTKTITEAINDNYSINEKQIDEEGSFFEVTLEGITNKSLLDFEELKNYLQMVAPVNHDPSSWSFQEKIITFSKKSGYSESLDTIKVYLCNSAGEIQHEIFRPFRDSFSTKNARSQRKRLVEVTDVEVLPKTGDYSGWWGWLAKHKRKGALADLPYAGLQIRLHNIALGDHSIIQNLWSTKSQAIWCFGEIHINSPELVPNSQRDNFEPSLTWEKIKKQLSEEVKLIEKDIRNESKERNTSINAITSKADKTATNVKEKLDKGLISYNEKNKLIEELEKNETKLKGLTHRQGLTAEDEEQLHKSITEIQGIKKSVSDVSRTKADDAVAHLNKQARKAVKTVMMVVREELNNDTQFSIIEKRVNAALQPGNKGR